MSQLHIRRIREAIDERFTNLIDLSDLAGSKEKSRRDSFLSRSLAALAIEAEHRCGDAAAALGVFDGNGDKGLDAIGVKPASEYERAHILLVQSKWNKDGKAKFTEDDARAMIRALGRIANSEFEPFNRRFHTNVRPGLEAALAAGIPKITLVAALLRTEDLSDTVTEEFESGIAEYNQVGTSPVVDYKVFDLDDAFREVAEDQDMPKIRADVQLECFGQEAAPYQAFYGTMQVADLAELYEEHKRALFAKNIRDALDVSDVNVKIRNTLLTEPDHFWYFSNGITILCEEIVPRRLVKPGTVASFDLKGLSVVNGAQTVSAIHGAYTADPLKAADGRVLVRLISLKDCPEGFGDQVTKSTNTQNPIKERDFKSLDPIQIKLRDDFAFRLSLTYVLKRGEPKPTPEHGCTITEAAEALAATHSNAEFAANAKRDLAILWEDETYRGLFGTRPSVYRIWRTVLLLRAVRKRLGERRAELQWRAASMASYGDLLITHIVFRSLSTRSITDPDADWQAELDRVSELVDEALIWVLKAVDAEYGSKSQVIAAVRNPERIQKIAHAAMRGMVSDEPAPTLEAAYQITDDEAQGRRANAVTTLVKAERIPDGTELKFRPVSGPEKVEMTEWLEEEPSRGVAVWRNSTTKQLQWQADGQWYSSSALVSKMRRMASGKDKDQAAQGPKYWFIPGEGTLDEIAEQVRAEQGLTVENEPGLFE